jgi:hypothetical protein
MAGMKTDMGGSAAVLGAFQAAVKSGVCGVALGWDGMTYVTCLFNLYINCVIHGVACLEGKISNIITQPPP